MEKKKVDKINKKGQGALEFIMMYGWAILAVLVSIGALAYFGVINLDRFAPDSCIIMPGISCNEFTVIIEEPGTAQITLVLRNGFPQSLNNVVIEIIPQSSAITGSQLGIGSCQLSCTDGCTLSGLNPVIPKDAITVWSGSCFVSSVEDVFIGDILFTYQLGGQSIQHTKTGKMKATIITKVTTTAETDTNQTTTNETTTNQTTTNQTASIGSCTESDGGINYYEKGIIYHLDNTGKEREYIDSCYLPGTLVEWYCDINGGVQRLNWKCEWGCIDGICYDMGETTCTDSDGGKDYYNQGQVTVTHLNGYVEGGIDSCRIDDTLTEWYCSSLGQKIAINGIVCPNGCKSGACIEGSAQSSCVDSDGGIDYFTAGIASKTLQSGSVESKSDFCNADNTITEWYCNDLGDIVSKNLPCEHGCDNGACIPSARTAVCTDSDGGKNIYVKGEATQVYFGLETIRADACSTTKYGWHTSDGAYIVEQYCSSEGIISADYIKCPSGYTCSGGVCIGS